MGKHGSLHLAYLGLCLHVWVFLNIYAMSAPAIPALDEMHMDSGSTSEAQTKRAEKQTSLADDETEILDTPRPIRKLSERSANYRNSVTLYENKDNANTRSLPQEDKRRLRFIKRRETGQDKHTSKAHNHNLYKREAFSRDRRTWSISNALSVLTDMVVEHEQRRLAEERDAMRRRLLEVGKRSEEMIRKHEAAGHGESDFVSLLQTALSSS